MRGRRQGDEAGAAAGRAHLVEAGGGHQVVLGDDEAREPRVDGGAERVEDGEGVRDVGADGARALVWAGDDGADGRRRDAAGSHERVDVRVQADRGEDGGGEAEGREEGLHVGPPVRTSGEVHHEDRGQGVFGAECGVPHRCWLQVEPHGRSNDGGIASPKRFDPQVLIMMPGDFFWNIWGIVFLSDC